MTLDELFAAEEAKAIARHRAEQSDPGFLARQVAITEENRRHEIAIGLRDADGDWIDTGEEDDDLDDADDRDLEAWLDD